MEIISKEEPYVVLKDGIATFYYNIRPEGSLTLPSGWYNSYWSDDTRNSVTKVVFDDSFKDYKPTSCTYWFCRFGNLTEISGMENLNTEKVTNMYRMFYWCRSLINLNISNFNTANVTNMRSMFFGCSSLTTLDVSNFNTENVKDMSGMFSFCSNLTTLDVSNFNTENVTDMSYMFNDCKSLTTIY